MKKRRRKKRGSGRRILLLSILIIPVIYVITLYQLPSADAPFFPLSNDEKNDSQAGKTNQPTDISVDELYSSSAILIRLNDQQILLEKNSSNKIYPASLTKIMTTIVALENISDQQQKVVLPDSIFHDLYEANASMAGFLPGEEVSLIDLLYGVMLPSGAESSIGLAYILAGSESNFVTLMNQKAVQLGMDNTHFANTTGLHDSDHYSTVEDIAVLLEYALQNPTFRDVFTAASHTTASTNLHPEGITFHSTMFSRMDTTDIAGVKVIGGKTGYTGQAGLCLASLAKENGEEYILITAGADGDTQTEQYNITDAFTVYSNLAKE